MATRFNDWVHAQTLDRRAMVTRSTHSELVYRGWTVGDANRALLLAVIAFAAVVAGALTQYQGRTASVWLANALIVAFVLRAPRSQWAALLAVGFVASVGGRLVMDETLLRAALLAAIASVESIIVLHLLPRRDGQASRFDSVADIRRFLLGAGLFGPLASATLAATVLPLAGGADFFAILVDWYVAHALGFLTLGAMLLVAPSEEAAETQGRTTGAVVGVLCCGVVSMIVFSQDNALLLSVVAPALLITTSCVPARSAMATLLACAGIAIGATAFGFGPIAQSDLDPTSRAHVVQGFIAAIVMVVLPVRALVAERNRLSGLIALSERLSWHIGDAAPSGVIHFDPLGRPTFVNRRWTELTGLDRAALDRGEWLEAIAASDRSAASSLWARARATLEPVTGEFRFTRSGGPAGVAELALYPEVEDGKVLGFAAGLTDVGARRRAEAAEQEREARYRLVTEIGQDVILRLGLDGRLLYASGASLRMTGYSPVELLGQPLTALVHAADVRLVEGSLKRNAEGLTDPTIAFRLRHRDGHFRWFETSQRVIFDDHGNPVEIVASLRDTEQYRRAEAIAATAAAQVRDVHRLLMLVEDASGVGHWHFDPRDKELDYSPQVDRIVMRARGDHLDVRGVLAIVHAADRRSLIACLARSRRRQGSAECVVRVTTRDGLRDVRVVAQVETEGDRAGCWTGVVTDITAAVAADAALTEAVAAARAAADAKSHFLATMSHDIRTPMTGVLGLIDLLRDDPVPAERDHFFATLKQSANALMAVLDDALGFSSVDHGTVQLASGEFDLEAVAMTTLGLFDHAASRKGLLVAFESACDTPPQVCGDAVRLQQILSSLLSMAIRLTDRGQIRLKLAATSSGAGESCYQFALGVDGITLEAGQLALFEPVPGSGDNATYGAGGSGLAISRRLAQAMGGDISVSSRRGEGTIFHFDLTLADALAVAGRRQRETGLQSGMHALDVLIAEDNPVNQMLIAAFVRRMGHALTVVENGRRAVAAAAADHYDVILMDMQMPEMDGLAATRAIRASAGPCADTTIIALTADASPERRRFYDGAGLSDFLTKPIDRAALAARLAAVGPSRKSRVTGRRVSATCPALVERQRIRELRSALGNDRLEALLGLLIAECLNRPALLRSALCRGDVAAVRAEGAQAQGRRAQHWRHRAGRGCRTSRGRHDRRTRRTLGRGAGRMRGGHAPGGAAAAERPGGRSRLRLTRDRRARARAAPE